MKKKKELIDGLGKLLMYFTIWILIVATCIMFAFKNSIYGYQLVISDYFNFIGSFGGAALSSIISFLILFITIVYNKSEQEENMLNSARPVIKIESRMFDNDVYAKEYYAVEDITKIENLTFIKFIIKNIGNGPARNIEMKLNETVITTSNGVVEKLDLGVGEETYILLLVRYDESFFIDENNFMGIICEDIFSKRQYEYKVSVVEGKISGNTMQMIEENVIEK